MQTDTPIAAAPTVETFADVTIYLHCAFNVNRIDCKAVTITRGVKYAQYNDATRVEFLEKGKRKPRGTMLTFRPFLIVLPTAEAIEPDGMFGSVEETPTATVSRGRYSSCDPGWVRDFMAKLEKSGVAPLVRIVTED
jgi:hypothetical protein